MNRKINLAVIGTGRMGSVHVANSMRQFGSHEWFIIPHVLPCGKMCARWPIWIVCWRGDSTTTPSMRKMGVPWGMLDTALAEAPQGPLDRPTESIRFMVLPGSLGGWVMPGIPEKMPQQAPLARRRPGGL